MPRGLTISRQDAQDAAFTMYMAGSSAPAITRVLRNRPECPRLMEKTVAGWITAGRWEKRRIALHEKMREENLPAIQKQIEKRIHQLDKLLDRVFEAGMDAEVGSLEGALYAMNAGLARMNKLLGIEEEPKAQGSIVVHADKAQINCLPTAELVQKAERVAKKLKRGQVELSNPRELECLDGGK